MLDITADELGLFSIDLYDYRYQQLQNQMLANHVEAHLIRDDLNITYLTGARYYSMERPVLLIAFADAPAILVVPKMEEQHLQGLENVADVRAYWEIDALPGRGWLSILRSTLSGFKSLGVEPSLDAGLFASLNEFSPTLLALAENLRIIKSNEELTILKSSGAIASQRLEKMLSGDIQGKLVGEIMARGAYDPDDDIFASYGNSCKLVMALQAGLSSASPHHISTRDQVITDGPCIVNSIVSYQGYNTECERTILVGDVDQNTRDIYECMREAQARALELIKPGESCADVDLAIQKYFTQAGYGDFMMHRVGHGMGLLPHEGPYISEGSADIFTPGMVVSCEPGLYVKGVGGFRHSDTLVITEQGHKLLTHYPSDLDSLSFQ